MYSGQIDQCRGVTKFFENMLFVRVHSLLSSVL